MHMLTNWNGSCNPLGQCYGPRYSLQFLFIFLARRPGDLSLLSSIKVRLLSEAPILKILSLTLKILSSAILTNRRSSITYELENEESCWRGWRLSKRQNISSRPLLFDKCNYERAGMDHGTPMSKTLVLEMHTLHKQLFTLGSWHLKNLDS